MDQGSKSSMKIILIIILLALAAYFAFFAKRGDSLEQSGRVINNSQISPDAPCEPLGSVYADNSATPAVGSECTIVMNGCYDHEGVVSYSDQNGQMGACCQDITQGDSSVGCVPILDDTPDSSLKVNKR